MVLKQFNHRSDFRIIGVDEAGRGSLAGNVVAATVILPTKFQLSGLTDSKKLSKKKRDIFYQQITELCDWSVGEASCIEIDQINILQATMLAMKRAIIDLQEEYSKYRGKTIFNVMVDGNRCPDVPNCIAIIKGDLSEPAISAASIIAKVTRDRQMTELDLQYPEYGFAQHKGYGTRRHINALSKYGAIKGVHRHSFGPIKELS
ncbi:ribonuclease HII [Candidatus Thioglobus sp.]|nr:ribonuclease HII [Candidatus Thioglobus sp.]